MVHNIKIQNILYNDYNHFNYLSNVIHIRIIYINIMNKIEKCV